MILIADSGSTKTEWLAVQKNTERQLISTVGLNPLFHTEESVYEALNNSEIKLLKNKIKEVRFYGAGCIPGQPIAFLEEVFRGYFTQATHVTVGSDMLGAAHALCGTEAGIACILGTGANSCLYDGEKIIDQVPAMGFILGDEGSGAVLGKKLINKVFKRNLPEEITRKFFEAYPITLQDAQTAVYKKPLPNKYLASFTVFLKQHIEHPDIYSIVYNGFEEFIQNNLVKYANHSEYRVHFVGSIAYHFEDVLIAALTAHNLKIGKILQRPIDDLANYFLNL